MDLQTLKLLLDSWTFSTALYSELITLQKVVCFCNHVVTSSDLVITKYKEQNPSWADTSASAGQEIPCILWNHKFH